MAGHGAGLARAAASGWEAGLGSDFRRQRQRLRLPRAGLSGSRVTFVPGLSPAASRASAPGRLTINPRDGLPPRHSEARGLRFPWSTCRTRNLRLSGAGGALFTSFPSVCALSGVKTAAGSVPASRPPGCLPLLRCAGRAAQVWTARLSRLWPSLTCQTA